MYTRIKPGQFLIVPNHLEVATSYMHTLRSKYIICMELGAVLAFSIIALYS